MSSNCKNCLAEIAGEEICPTCFAPASLIQPCFTGELEPASAGLGVAYLAPHTLLPDLKQVRFRPSSFLYRTATRMKGGVASALVAVLFVGAGIYWWVDSHISKAAAAEKTATRAYQTADYHASLAGWETATRNYAAVFNKPGQAHALVEISKCHVQLGQLQEALAVSQRAQKLLACEETDDSVLKCHRTMGNDHLEGAKSLFQPDLYGKAFLEAKAAIECYRLGQAGPEQMSGAYRMAARCSARLKDFEGAQDYLDQALQSEGESAKNVALSKELARDFALYRQNRLADSNKNGYIPQGKLDPAALQALAERNTRSTRRRVGSYSWSYGGSAWTKRAPVYSRPSYYSRPTVRTSVETSVDYPTHQKYKRRSTRYSSGSSGRTTRSVPSVPRFSSRRSSVPTIPGKSYPSAPTKSTRPSTRLPGFP